MKHVLLIFIAVVSLLSCSNNDTENNPTPTTPQQPTTPTTPDTTVTTGKKTWLLTYIEDDTDYGSGLSLEYDDNRRLKKIIVNNPTREFPIYYANDTIHHVISTREFNGGYTRTSAIFLYDANKQCYKVIYKKPLSTYDVPSSEIMDDTNPYYSNSTDGQYRYADSLVYSSTNQLTEIWEMADSDISAYHKFIYADLQKAAPEKVESYYVGDDSNISLKYEIFLTTTEMDQPAYKFLWIAPFVSTLSIHDEWTIDFTIPVTPLGTSALSKSLMVLVPKCITKHSTYSYYIPSTVENSPEFTYLYNADSTIFRSHYMVDDGSFPRFSYWFTKK